MSLSPDAASMQKKLFCVVFQPDMNVFSGDLAKPLSPMKEQHLLNSCGKSDRAVGGNTKSILPFEPFEVYSSRQLQEILCWELEGQAILTETRSSLTRNPTPGGGRESELAYSGWWGGIWMQWLICHLVRSCNRSNFVELSGKGCTMSFCLLCSYSFIILAMVDNITFWYWGSMDHIIFWKDV